MLQVVAPKKLKLAEAEATLAVQMEKLNAKRAELKSVSPHCMNALTAVDSYYAPTLAVRVSCCFVWCLSM